MDKKHTLVIGGTMGLGRALVKSWVERDHIISVIGRNFPLVSDENIKNVYYLVLDLLDGNSISKTLANIIDENGKLNNLVFFQRYRGDGDDWSGEIDVSVTSTKIIIEYLKDKFDDKNGSSIVMISSMAGNFIAEEQPLSYHVAKAAINQMARYYAVKLGPRGIRVNCISSGTVIKDESKTFYLSNVKLHNLYNEITPLRRMATSKDIVNAVSFLCSQKSSFITGQNIVVDGGVSLQMHESFARKLADLNVTKKEE